MHINLETTEHTIQSYDEHKLQIDSIVYDSSLIVSKEEIISDLAIKHIQEINDEYLQKLLQYQPEVILIGHNALGHFPSPALVSQLATKRIGMECMSIGAACRTYNVLLSEHRKVVAGFIFSPD